MDVRFGFLLLLVLGFGLASAARQMTDDELSHSSMVISDIMATQMNDQGQEKENQDSSEVVGNKQVCTLCEEFASQALDYLAANKTQTEIIDILHQACSRARNFKPQCITLVDYYAPLFFLEISSVQPTQFCQKVNLCQKIALISLELKQDRCALCHRAVSEVLIKLKDPDTQLEIIELLLKGCDSMENYAAKCKKLVFEFGPVILINAEQFLESKDICTMLHACNEAKVDSGEVTTVALADS